MNQTPLSGDKHPKTAALIWVLFVAVVVLGAGLRWVNFATFPPGLWYDEAYTLEHARRIVQEGVFQIYYPDKHGEPGIFWLTALALRFGAGYLAPRWVSAISGLISIVLLFFAVRDVLRDIGATKDWLALGSTGVLAINYTFLFYTRMHWQPAVATPFFILTAWFFWRGLKSGHRLDFVITGVSAGAAQYICVSARMLPLVCLLEFGVWLCARDRNVRWRARWSGLLLMGACAIIIYLPMARAFLMHPEWFSRRLSTAAALADILPNIGRVLGGWIYLGDAGIHNLPGQPIYTPTLAVLLLTGTLIALLRWRHPAYSLWLVWLIACLPGGFLSNPAPMFYRYLSAIPASAVLCAIGGSWWWKQWASRFPNRRHWGTLVLAGLFIFNTGSTIYDYFVRWADEDSLLYVMDVGKLRAAEVVQTSPQDERLFVTIPDLEPVISYGVHTRSRPPRVFDGERCFIYPVNTTIPTRYVSIQGYEHRSQAYLQELYPGLTPIIDPLFGDNEPYFVEFVLPSNVESPVLGALDTPIAYGEIVLWGFLPTTRQVQAGQTLDVTLTWRATHQTPTSYTIFVHLLDGRPEASETPLRAQYDAPPCMNSAPTQTWQPDEYIVEVRSLDIPADLAPGDYLLGVGIYNSTTLERIPSDSDWVQWDEAILGTITVITL
jgi:hypothetical protein